MTRFAVQNKLIKPFAVYIYLKMNSDGKVHESSEIFSQLVADLKIRDKRTLQKYLADLQTVNWVGYNAASGYYFIRGFDKIRKTQNFKNRQASTFYQYDFGKFSSYANGVLICAAINRMKYKKAMERRISPAATQKRDVAIQPGASSHNLEQGYFGLSNTLLATILGCKKTRACVIKKKADTDGFIEIIHHYKHWATFDQPDYHIKQQLSEIYPELKGRLLIIKEKRKLEYKLVEQQYDEIIPKIQFKTISKFNNLDKKRRLTG